MEWRFVVDEDTDTDCATELVDRGFDAVTVADTLGKGRSDRAVIEFAHREDRLLVTTDRGFLDAGLHAGVRVLLVADDAATGRDVAENVAEIVRLADAPSDLRPVTWI